VDAVRLQRLGASGIARNRRLTARSLFGEITCPCDQSGTDESLQLAYDFGDVCTRR